MPPGALDLQLLACQFAVVLTILTWLQTKALHNDILGLSSEGLRSQSDKLERLGSSIHVSVVLYLGTFGGALGKCLCLGPECMREWGCHGCVKVAWVAGHFNFLMGVKMNYVSYNDTIPHGRTIL